MSRLLRFKAFRLRAVGLIPLWILIVLLQSSVSSSALHYLELGMEAPDFTLADLDKTSRSLSGLMGSKLTVVVFWATWGENSKKALRQMQGFYQTYEKNGLSVIGINVDRQDVDDATMVRIRDTATSMKLTFPVLIDQGLRTFNAYGIIAAPTLLILDTARIIRYELSGFPLMGADGMKQFVTATMEHKALPVQAVATDYQPDKKAVRLWNMGLSSLKSERTSQRAKLWFEKAIAADPSFSLPHLSLGSLYYRQNNLAEARKQFELVLQKKPEHAVALNMLGQVLLDEGKLPEAELMLTKAVQADESYQSSYYLLGLLKGRQGDVVQAQRWFRRAEQLNPSDYKLYVYEGMMAEERNEPVAAVAGYKKALKLIVGTP
jgi:Tfp pilus assembly protein PilF/peroxiredoxin